MYDAVELGGGHMIWNGSARDPLWYKDAIIYEVPVKSFSDGNADGVGDFLGLSEKLDYLQDLGVTCIWLLPFFPSPLKDDGYDISDYRNIHASYGTLGDVKAFLTAAHARRLQVVIELVLNHTSDQHPWFQRARLAPPNSPERDYYVWSDTDQRYAAARTIFVDTERSNWAWDPVAKAYYNQWPADVRAYFGDSDECHMAYHFPLMPRIFMALHLEDRQPIVEIMERTPTIPENCQWALFLRNHDELTLEMVTDDERDYMYLAYSADPQARLNVGIRRRLAPLVGNDRRRIELLTGLLFSFPGTPVIYYGDEIGMGDNLYLGDRNGVRTPMQWTGDRNGGFSRADPARLYSPIIMDPVYGYQAVSVEAQESDTASLLYWMRNMIRLRKQFKVFGRGTMEFLQPTNQKVLVYIRRYRDDVILCAVNLSRTVQPVELDLSAFAGLVPVEMLGYTEFPPIGTTPYFLTLGPYGFYWFELQHSRS